MQDVGNSARGAVDHLDEGLLQRLRVSVYADDVTDDAAALHVEPCGQDGPDGLDLAVGGRPLHPEVEGVLVADDVLHHLQARGVALALDHHLVLPLPEAVGGEVPGRLRALHIHEVLDIPGDGLDGGVALPLPALRLCLEAFIEHLDRAQVGGEAFVEPDVLDDGLLLVGEAREGARLLRLPAQGQGSEVVPVLAVLLFELQRPGVRLEHVLHVAVKALRADPEPQGVPLGVARPIGAVVVDEVLHPGSELDGLIKPLLVRLGVLVEVGTHIPGRGLVCSTVYDDVPPFHFLRGPPRFSRFR